MTEISQSQATCTQLIHGQTTCDEMVGKLIGLKMMFLSIYYSDKNVNFEHNFSVTNHNLKTIHWIMAKFGL